MRAFVFKPTAIAVALALSVSSPLLAQQAPAGASKASSSAVGGVGVGTIGAVVAVVAAAAALSGGSGGASSGGANASSTSSAAATAATAAAQTATGNANDALAILRLEAGIDPILLAAAEDALRTATTLQAAARAAASDFALANTVAVAGVVNPVTGVRICAAAASCTNAERLLLAYDAARLAKAAVEATLIYIAAVEALSSTVTNKLSSTFATGTANIALALANALAAQISANAAITAYIALATSLGATFTSVAFSTGTTGSVGASGTSVDTTRGSR